VRCPKCQTVFKTSAPAPAAPAFEVIDEALAPPKPQPRPGSAARPVAPPPPKPAPPQSNPFTNLDDEDRPRKKRRDDDEDDDDRPRSKNRSRDDDDDDRPRKKRRDEDDDEEDRPRSKKRNRDDDDDDDDDDRPRRKRKDRDDTDYSPPGKRSKFGLARTGVLLVLISLGLYAGSMALQVLFIAIALIGGVIPSGMGLVTGLMGLVNWIVGIVGLGFCIAGPSRARGLAIAAVSVAAVHLILSFITVNDSDSAGANSVVPMLSGFNSATNVQNLAKELLKEEQKNPGSPRAKELREELKSLNEDTRDEGIGFGGLSSSRDKMRWADMTTHLTFLDKLIALLVYDSKHFSKALLGLFTGLSELARLILIALMLGSLGYAAKSDRAISQAKFGWIIAASAGGAALLVMLLAFVIADSASKDVKDSASKISSPEDLEKFRERQESAVRAPIRWLGIGEFLVLILHIGSVAMPALAALAIFSATGGGGDGRPRYRKRTSRNDDDDDD
jgi:hypothetical protein